MFMVRLALLWLETPAEALYVSIGNQMRSIVLIDPTESITGQEWLQIPLKYFQRSVHRYRFPVFVPGLRDDH